MTIVVGITSNRSLTRGLDLGLPKSSETARISQEVIDYNFRTLTRPKYHMLYREIHSHEYYEQLESTRGELWSGRLS